MTTAWRIDALDPRHDRESFDCGGEPLNRYLRLQATQDERRLIARCFVMVQAGAAAVAGYYTLAAGELPLSAIPLELSRRLPRYPVVPVVRMGRLAVDRNFHGEGFGSMLIINAIGQIRRSEIAAYALLVDAKDESAAAFYRRFGFLETGDADRRLFLPLPTAQKLFG